MPFEATATPQTVIDIQHSLKINNCAMFISSFVRSNLQYDIFPKSAANFKKIIDMLKTKYKSDSGIIYCLSRYRLMFRPLHLFVSEMTVRWSPNNYPKQGCPPSLIMPN